MAATAKSVEAQHRHKENTLTVHIHRRNVPTSDLRVKYNENRGFVGRPSGEDVVEKSYVSVSFRNALLLAAVHPCCARAFTLVMRMR